MVFMVQTASFDDLLDSYPVLKGYVEKVDDSYYVSFDTLLDFKKFAELIKFYQFVVYFDDELSRSKNTIVIYDFYIE